MRYQDSLDITPQGIEDVLHSAGLRLGEIAQCDWQPQDGYREVRSLLHRREPPSAIICCNDRLAMGTYQALAEAGLTVPRDVSIASFDDSPLASWMRPALTSIALPHSALGRTAVELLIEDRTSPATYRIPMPVRRRSSVGPPADR